jgi:hypothetical protein
MKTLINFLSIAFALLVIGSCETNKGSFLLINNSEESISKASVKVCGQTIELKNIPPSESAKGTYQVKSDSHFDIIIDFKNGKKLQKQIGYVTNGIDFRHKTIVTNSDIDIQLLSPEQS